MVSCNQSNNIENQRGNSSTSGAVNSTNGARGNQLPDLDAEGKVARPDSLHQEQVLLLGLGDELLGLFRGDGERLFAQDILARLEREHGVLKVVAVGSGNVDDIDVGVRDKLGVRAVGLGGRGALDLFDEADGAVGGARRSNGGNLVADIVNVANGGVAEQILAECCGGRLNACTQNREDACKSAYSRRFRQWRECPI